MATDTDDSRLGTHYVGLFGTLCKYVPIFDADAPDGWALATRRFDRTAWHHPVGDVNLVCENTSDGWEITVTDHGGGYAVHTLPRNANRWTAFEAVRAFFDGEPLMVADSGPDTPSLVTLAENGVEWR
ncbi:hypothetical protein [Natrinema thermotolerans]|uniref:hypothetical protein n=1 Tax=Natrinema thermotolerans TaxID=121872 RepID=UPI0006793EB2|nr:hypothetical protein [Natrinema thermotolerans]QCC57231.1 hypothetical protein DVR14_00730 [Natrinema thermotolerans]